MQMILFVSLCITCVGSELVGLYCESTFLVLGLTAREADDTLYLGPDVVNFFSFTAPRVTRHFFLSFPFFFSRSRCPAEQFHTA